MYRALVLAAFATIITAMLVVNTRHETRLRYAHLQQLKIDRDAFNTEWEQLLLEEGAFAQHQRIEHTARTLLDMHLPDRDHIDVVRTGPRP